MENVLEMPSADGLQERVRALFDEMGGRMTARTLAETALDRGIFDDMTVESFTLRGAMVFVKKALKVKLEDGLPKAKPIGEHKTWVNRYLWDYAEFCDVIANESIGIVADHKGLRGLREWGLDRFGRAPEIPELLVLAETEAA